MEFSPVFKPHLWCHSDVDILFPINLEAKCIFAMPRFRAYVSLRYFPAGSKWSLAHGSVPSAGRAAGLRETHRWRCG